MQRVGSLTSSAGLALSRQLADIINGGGYLLDSPDPNITAAAERFRRYYQQLTRPSDAER